VHEAHHALLGRRHPTRAEALKALTEQHAADLLADAERQLGRGAVRQVRRGRVAREVLAATDGVELLVMARDGDVSRPGPQSLGATARFVADHAPCAVLLVWPEPAAQ
jgi:nucleotide-binding universal stress UspA family protein